MADGFSSVSPTDHRYKVKNWQMFIKNLRSALERCFNVQRCFTQVHVCVNSDVFDKHKEKHLCRHNNLLLDSK